MKSFDVSFNLGFGMQVDAEDDYDAEQIFRNMNEEDFIAFVKECMEHSVYNFDDDVYVRECDAE